VRFQRILLFPPMAPRDGDATGALMTGLRRRYPGAVIDRVLADGEIEPAGGGDPGDGEGRRPRGTAVERRGLLAAAARARRGGYDLAVVIDRTPRAALIPFLAGIPFRIGPGSRAGRLLFSIAVPFAVREGPKERVERILAVLDPHAPPSPAVRPEGAVRG